MAPPRIFPPHPLARVDDSTSRATLPTMYDLPSEDPKEPGLPDEFHLHQPQLLAETFQPPGYPPERVFVASDLNLYYDLAHPLWYKRPDWFAVLGNAHLYAGSELRLSYVSWQECVSPYLAIELLSPGTEQEDLGQTQRRTENNPPTKWQVYEEILKIPYYVVFNRVTNRFRAFALRGGRYRELPQEEQRLWLPEAALGLGVWPGSYHRAERHWLRFYDAREQWILTPYEQERQNTEQERQNAELARQSAALERQNAALERQRTEQERQRAVQEHLRAERLAAQLRALGIEPDV